MDAGKWSVWKWIELLALLRKEGHGEQALMEMWKVYLEPTELSVGEVLKTDGLDFEERAFPLVAIRYQPSIGGEVNSDFSVSSHGVPKHVFRSKKVSIGEVTSGRSNTVQMVGYREGNICRVDE